MITNYQKAESFLNSFINYEKVPFFPYAQSLKLKQVYLLFNCLKIPYKKLRVIHIAGTKGKGSTASFCTALLTASGYKVGLYTSPHFFDFRERIKIGTKDKIPQKDLVRILEEFRKKLEEINLSKITFFEITTALAFKYFLEQKVDYAVLETGLGGRLDATNISKSILSIITHISYDHTHLLGRKLSQITKEKAGIIKPNVPLVCSRQNPVCLKVIKAKAKNSKTYVLGQDFKPENIRLKKDYTLFDFKFNRRKLKDLRIKLKGKHQVENACLALAGVSLLEDKIKVKAGLKNCSLEGRFEIIKKKPLIIADIAHNFSSFSVLRKSLELYFPGKKIILIFGCSEDKDAQAMLKEINYSSLILTKSTNLRASDPKRIKRVGSLSQAYIMGNVKAAIEKALKLYRKDCLILVSGSLFLVAEAKKHA